LVPALTVLYLMFGWIGEIRVYIEALPAIWAIADFRGDPHLVQEPGPPAKQDDLVSAAGQISKQDDLV